MTTLDSLLKFMIKNKILEAKSGDLHLKLDPSALQPKMTPKERKKWEEKVEKTSKEVDNIDIAIWSV